MGIVYQHVNSITDSDLNSFNQEKDQESDYEEEEDISYQYVNSDEEDYWTDSDDEDEPHGKNYEFGDNSLHNSNYEEENNDIVSLENDILTVLESLAIPRYPSVKWVIEMAKEDQKDFTSVLHDEVETADMEAAK